jgi:hypothetical protein
VSVTAKQTCSVVSVGTSVSDIKKCVVKFQKTSFFSEGYGREKRSRERSDERKVGKENKGIMDR